MEPKCRSSLVLLVASDSLRAVARRHVILMCHVQSVRADKVDTGPLWVL